MFKGRDFKINTNGSYILLPSSPQPTVHIPHFGDHRFVSQEVKIQEQKKWKIISGFQT